jgi:hypothetical protein
MGLKNYLAIRKASPAPAADDEVLVRELRHLRHLQYGEILGELSGTTFAGTVHFTPSIMFRKG